MSSNLSVAQILANLEGQLAHLESQRAFHAQQEVFHGEQKVHCDERLQKVRERYEAFKAASAAAGEIVQAPAPKAAAAPALPEPDGRGRLPTLTKLVARLVQGKAEEATFSPSTVNAELNEHYGKKLRKPIETRSVSVALRRLLAEGRVYLVREGRPFHEALYGKGRKPPSRKGE